MYWINIILGSKEEIDLNINILNQLLLKLNLMDNFNLMDINSMAASSMWE